MENGYRCLYLNSPAMVSGMRSSLASMGVNVASHIAQNKIMLSSETVSANEDFNSEQMLQKLEDALDQALKDGYKGLWASGDMTWELGSEKNFEKLLEYEWKLEALFHKRKELNGVCQYHHDTLPNEVMRQGLLLHQTLYISDTLSRINPHHINASLSSEVQVANPVLDKMIAELCQSNVETKRILKP